MSSISEIDENPYNLFAPIYNSHWGRNSLAFLPLYLEHALDELPAQAQVMDLCCGTGQFSQALSERGFRVSGIDSATGMLSFARANAPEARFLCADIRNFRSPIEFDAAVCVYDSLNHLLAIDDLSLAFETVHLCLQINGMFAFDMNMEEKYRNSWRGEFTVDESDAVYEIVTRTDHQQRIATLAACAKSYRNDERLDDRILFCQTWYSRAEIVRGLSVAGFGEIETVSLSDQNPGDPGRMLFVCRKV